jgi:hypothetical protein
LTVIFSKTFSFNSIATGIGCLVGLACGLAAGPVHATDLTVVHQSALEFVCMFDGDCRSSITPAGVGAITPPEPSSDPRLFASSFPAKSGSPGDGTTVYLYRVDLITADKASECLSGVVLNFGPLAEIPPVNGNTAHVFVITSGDSAGTIPVKSAEQDGDFIQFNFDGGLCPGKSSLMFALPSKHPPGPSGATIFGYGYPPVTTARTTAPKHSPEAPGNLRVNPE